MGIVSAFLSLLEWYLIIVDLSMFHDKVQFITISVLKFNFTNKKLPGWIKQKINRANTLTPVFILVFQSNSKALEITLL